MNKLEQAARRACQTPLKDLLRSVPKDGRDCYEESSTSHHFIPYGRLIHEALTEIERLEALAEQAEHEPEVWYCPDCGTLSETQVKCCPDWIRSRKVPKNFALTCKATFDRNVQAEQEPVARHNIIGYQPINNSASVIAPPKNPNGKSEQSPVAIKQLPDPYDERDGVWFDAEGLQRLRELPVGTKLYAAPVTITTPDVCGEVCARAKLCYGCNKDLEEANTKFVEQAEQECKDCTRSHPHEEMSKCCELRTEIARLRHSLRVKELAEQAEQEPVIRATLAPPAPPEVYQMRSKDAYEAGWWEAQRQKAVSPIAPAKQAEQEPVGYFLPPIDESDVWEEAIDQNCPTAVPLYAAPVHQAEQGPVACIVRDCCEAEKADPDHSDTICIAVNDLTEIVTHHTTAPVQQAEQEPVAVVEITYGRDPECYVTGNIDDFPEGVFKLYAAPVRTKDLTAQEKANIIYAADHRNPMAMIDAAIALYREKNR